MKRYMRLVCSLVVVLSFVSRRSGPRKKLISKPSPAFAMRASAIPK